MTGAAYRVAIAGEDWGHYRATTRLADRVLAERTPWYADCLDSEELRAQILQWGVGPAERPWSYVTKAYQTARARGLNPYGHFNGEPGRSDAWMFRAQLLLFQADRADGEHIDAVIIARDVDDDPARIEGARKALALGWPFPVILALCNPEVEAWHVAGFDPEDNAEHARLATLRGKLGFSPPRAPHLLHSKRPEDPKDAKSACDHLCGADPVRKASCLDAPLDRLREHGADCGLADYLTAVENLLVPILSDSPRR